MRVKLESREKIKATLRTARPFDGWPQAAINSLACESELRHYAQGEIIEERGNPATGLWVVGTGSVCLFHSTGDGKYFLNAVVWPGDTFGLFPAVDDWPAPLSYSARRESLIVFVPRKALWVALGDADRLREMAILVARRARLDIEMRISAYVDPLPARLAKILAFLPRRSQVMDDEPPVEPGPSPIDLTQDELANMLGVSRQTLNRTLGPFLRSRIVMRNGQGIRVINFKGLLAIMEQVEPLPDVWRREILSWDERIRASASEQRPALAQPIQNAAER